MQGAALLAALLILFAASVSGAAVDCDARLRELPFGERWAKTKRGNHHQIWKRASPDLLVRAAELSPTDIAPNGNFPQVRDNFICPRYSQ